ncbi:small ribosomal subunit protein bS1m-like [Antedon mediterranea]|uniref:small ribosomal subunit protein bS1m-like n=1 Tax=Antedon mediterranea TaxID=105859 RepID=UPI003AF99BAD
MAASMTKVLGQRFFELNRVYCFIRSISSTRYISSKETNNKEPNNISVESNSVSSDVNEHSKLGGFAQAFAKFTDRLEEQYKAAALARDEPTKHQSFATLFRNSAFVNLGNIKGQIVIGKIFHIVEDDLYIDFGGKLHCVCERPSENASKYVRGARVRLLLKDFEMAEHFIGAKQDLTLLEADAQLLGLQEAQYFQASTDLLEDKQTNQ